MTPSEAMNKKRFYKTATVAEEAANAFQVLLDGRSIKTPAGRTLSLPTAALAAAVADEWNAQGEFITPATLPLTKLANTAIDGVEDRKAEVIDDIVRYAASDAICYRAAYPAGLAERQSELWDPILNWVERDYGAVFSKASGIAHREQPPESLAAVRDAISGLNSYQLAALHVMTGLTGSALIPLAYVNGFLGLEEAWRAGHVDEDWQSSHWGEDFEAARRKEGRLADFQSAARFFQLSK
jgi:chaperone required for assembly of F1-ATPase